LYPDIQKSYDLAQDLRNIFEKTTDKIIGLGRLGDGMKVNQSDLVFQYNLKIDNELSNHIKLF
jgi:hypothetical protein